MVDQSSHSIVKDTRSSNETKADILTGAMLPDLLESHNFVMLNGRYTSKYYVHSPGHTYKHI